MATARNRFLFCYLPTYLFIGSGPKATTTTITTTTSRGWAKVRRISLSLEKKKDFPGDTIHLVVGTRYLFAAAATTAVATVLLTGEDIFLLV